MPPAGGAIPMGRAAPGGAIPIIGRAPPGGAIPIAGRGGAPPGGAIPIIGRAPPGAPGGGIDPGGAIPGRGAIGAPIGGLGGGAPIGGPPASTHKHRTHIHTSCELAAGPRRTLLWHAQPRQGCSRRTWPWRRASRRTTGWRLHRDEKIGVTGGVRLCGTRRALGVGAQQGRRGGAEPRAPLRAPPAT